MTTTKAQAFAALHVKGTPVELFNCWDAGSASAIAAAGAPALATGSWAVAAAQGYQDGQAYPVARLLDLAARIVEAHDLPVSVDFEGGYGDDPADVAGHAKALAATGVVGLNFEDRKVHGTGLWSIEAHCARIAGIRATVGPDFFLNARTDVFLQAPADDHAAVLPEAIARGVAFARAGASGFFVPMLGDAALIAQVCAQVPLPVNVMVQPALASRAGLCRAGVARISHGPASYRAAMAAVQALAGQSYTG